MSVTAKVILNKRCDWDEESGAWIFQYARIPNVELSSIIVGASTIDQSDYHLNQDAGLIKWHLDEIPDKASAILKFPERKIFSFSDNMVKIIIALIALTGTLAGGFFGGKWSFGDENLMEQISQYEAEVVALNGQVKTHTDSIQSLTNYLEKQNEILVTTTAMPAGEVLRLNSLITDNSNLKTINQRQQQENDELERSSKQITAEHEAVVYNSGYEIHLLSSADTKNSYQTDLMRTLRSAGFLAHECLWRVFPSATSNIIYYSSEAKNAAVTIAGLMANTQNDIAFNVNPIEETLSSRKKHIQISIR